MNMSPGTRRIETSTGLRIDPLDPDPKLIVLEDIAHALSQQCRFTGHTSRFFSIAEHSLYVADLLFMWDRTCETIAAGLLHDASEAYLCDVPSPLKYDLFGTEYRERERCLTDAINERFRIPAHDYAAVKQADEVLLWCEAHSLLQSCGTSWGLYDERGRKIIDENPDVVEWIYLQKYADGYVTTKQTFLSLASRLGIE